ncbi:hypothetical protein [Thalassolituus marinus]|uniref:Uncharacterized protein n=1 Tax=Thalassolituus marinus TaxID=671053 RepID=A0ABS7ZST9_9GAMM|nr:hypothetical protein [Thalassolituus marinus]MCA6064308.1 hypothetical protein [Thalassolituus marinus]
MDGLFRTEKISISLPELKSMERFSTYIFQVNDLRVILQCDGVVGGEPVYEYSYTPVRQGVTPNLYPKKDMTLPFGSMRLPVDAMQDDFYNWSSLLNVVFFPITSIERPILEERLKEAIERAFDEGTELSVTGDECEKIRSYQDIDILTVEGRKWAYTSCGNLDRRDLFVTELSADLALQIDFDSSPCWHRKGYAPEPVKQHLMKFYLDYLSHVKIIPVGSVPDSELPPLGFYPAEREEKAIDAEGRVVESKPDSDSSETTMGW